MTKHIHIHLHDGAGEKPKPQPERRGASNLTHREMKVKRAHTVHAHEQARAPKRGEGKMNPRPNWPGTLGYQENPAPNPRTKHDMAIARANTYNKHKMKQLKRGTETWMDPIEHRLEKRITKGVGKKGSSR
jgi:hypothetical protein